MFANIVIRPLPLPLTYKIPEDLVAKIRLGSKVEAPLGKSRVSEGYVIDLFESFDGDTKKIKEIDCIVFSCCFNSSDLEFYKWIAEYYGEPLSVVIDTAIPNFKPPKQITWAKLMVANFSELKIRSLNQQKALNILSNSQDLELPVDSIAAQLENGTAAVRELAKKGLILLFKKDAELNFFDIKPAEWAKTCVDLDEAQTEALEEIKKILKDSTNNAALLHGVTGSGKTEVYIEAIQSLIEQEKSSLVLVPEIALTPQLVDRFFARLGNNVAVLHSGLTDKERWANWELVRNGTKKVLIGARSALFCPIPNLGLIVVDEEHDSSFKQNEGLRYNARDLTFVKARIVGATVLLGSATPSIETFHRATSGQIKYLPLKSRHKSASQVAIDVIDLTKLRPWEMPSTNISPMLFQILQECLQNNEQAFILYNRRGFSHYVQCDKCETSVSCPNCAITLTFHQNKNLLLCHSCSFSSPVPTFCPNCSKSKDQIPGQLSMRGAGTEKTEDEIKRLFPDAEVLRLDRDVASNINDYQRVLDTMRAGKANFLVGTQMIAKGHDLPNVTVAAVIDCDVGLHIPDFRASERVFQLISQLSGRAGRGSKPGRVILQTRVPKHPSITFTAKHDFEGFAKYECENRKTWSYPPFGRLLRIIVAATDEGEVKNHIFDINKTIKKYLEHNKDEVSVLGPTTCAIERLRAKYRWHILVKSKNPISLLKISSVVRENIKINSATKIILDMDPQDML